MTRCGIDTVEISRIDEAIKKNPDFLNRVFSGTEIEYSKKKKNGIESLAGFFAAKEAFSKYLGTGVSGFNLNDVSVEHSESGTPFIVFRGDRQDVSLSISHNETTAVAVVCGDNEDVAEPPLKAEMMSLMPTRPENSNKGDFGRVLIVGGSRGMTGAAVLSAYSALRTGAGLVTLATAESERAIAAGFYPEIMTAGLDAKNGIICASATKELLRLSTGKNSIVFGPGLGQSPEILPVLAELLRSYTGSLVIDADGLNALSKNVGILKEKSCEVILTPHPGEMSRLVGREVEEVQQNRQEIAEKFAKEYDVCIILKGHASVVAKKGCKTFINPTGNPGLSTAGTGDVLAGMVAAFLAQGLDLFNGAILGVYVHGLSGDIAKEPRGAHGMVASDVIDAIPEAILKILK